MTTQQNILDADQAVRSAEADTAIERRVYGPTWTATLRAVENTMTILEVRMQLDLNPRDIDVGGGVWPAVTNLSDRL